MSTHTHTVQRKKAADIPIGDRRVCFSGAGHWDVILLAPDAAAASAADDKRTRNVQYHERGNV